MKTADRRNEIIAAANRYSQLAIDEGTDAAAKRFYNDYFDGVWTCNEHTILIPLIQWYINCKCGALARDECKRRQNEILKHLEE